MKNQYGDSVTAALLTDKYELTMLAAALRDGTAHRQASFEVFARRLPFGRRYGVVAGTGRFLSALADFRFDDSALASLDFLDAETLQWLADYEFRGDIDGYPEGELYFPDSPVLSIHGTFAECVILETLVLSIFNHDTAIASAAARMVSAAVGRPLIEMGSRRTHEQAACLRSLARLQLFLRVRLAAAHDEVLAGGVRRPGLPADLAGERAPQFAQQDHQRPGM